MNNGPNWLSYFSKGFKSPTRCVYVWWICKLQDGCATQGSALQCLMNFGMSANLQLGWRDLWHKTKDTKARDVAHDALKCNHITRATVPRLARGTEGSSGAWTHTGEHKELALCSTLCTLLAHELTALICYILEYPKPQGIYREPMVKFWLGKAVFHAHFLWK